MSKSFSKNCQARTGTHSNSSRGSTLVKRAGGTDLWPVNDFNYRSRLTCFFSCLLLFFTITPDARLQTILLTLGHTVEGQVFAGAPAQYLLPLQSGDYVVLFVDPKGASLRLSLYLPAGEKDRIFSLNPNEINQVRFKAGPTGAYRLGLEEAKNVATASFHITWVERKTMDENLKPAPTQETFHSPRLQSLQNELKQGDSPALEKFWQESQKKGAPFIKTNW